VRYFWPYKCNCHNYVFFFKPENYFPINNFYEGKKALKQTFAYIFALSEGNTIKQYIMTDNKNRVHVIKRDDGWVTRKDGSTRASRKFNSKQDAIESAIPLRHDGYDLVIHSIDGSVEDYWYKDEE
jgi:hypothetical protein